MRREAGPRDATRHRATGSRANVDAVCMTEFVSGTSFRVAVGESRNQLVNRTEEKAEIMPPNAPRARATKQLSSYRLIGWQWGRGSRRQQEGWDSNPMALRRGRGCRGCRPGSTRAETKELEPAWHHMPCCP